MFKLSKIIIVITCTRETIQCLHEDVIEYTRNCSKPKFTFFHVGDTFLIFLYIQYFDVRKGNLLNHKDNCC